MGKEREVGEKDCMQYTINSLLSRGILNTAVCADCNL